MSILIPRGRTDQAQISLDAGVTISNNITLNTVRSLSGGNGDLRRTNGDVNDDLRR